MKTDITITLPLIQQFTKKTGPLLSGHIDDKNLYTAFQPVFSLAHKRAVGYEALLRVKEKDSRWTNPAALFDTRKSAAEIIYLDRLCRYIHLNNFLCLNDNTNWLFLNVSPKTLLNGKAYGSFFNQLLTSFNFPAHRIVIEVVEHPIEDNDLLMDCINFYKNLGCLIAIDDFGAGHSNFDRIWTLKPDIVKLDRSFTVRASQQKNIRNLLPEIISLLHQTGALVLLEGIETHDQAMIAIDSDTDFAQGFYFGKPSTQLISPPKMFEQFETLFDQYKTASNKEKSKFRSTVNQYTNIFSTAVKRLRKNIPIEQAVKELLLKPSVVRCYQIGTNGIQIGNTILPKSYGFNKDKRFKPLEDTDSADWFRRHYLKQAILHPDQLQVTRPYLSITGAHMCITLSMKFSNQTHDSVLCCDIVI